MLRDLEVPFLPSTTDCLSWSEDGELAIAAAEHVHILVPKHKTARNSDQSNGLPTFEGVRFRANTFTSEEWPPQQPDSGKLFSLGEEQSASNVVAASWSPPGPARHRRSLLAVLTTNLVLSIWAPTRDPKDPRNWERVKVVNNTIRDYFERIQQHGSFKASKGEDLIRLRTRIRAFSWSKACFIDGTRRDTQRYQKWGLSLLAVANDNNEIVLLHFFTSDGLIQTHSKHWHAEVLGHFRGPPSSGTLPFLASSSLLAAALNRRPFVSELSWSPWTTTNGRGMAAILSYLAGDKLRFRRVFIKNSKTVAGELLASNSLFTLDVDEQDLDLHNDHITAAVFTGPLRWYDKVCNHRLVLAAAARDQMYIISLLGDTPITRESAEPAQSPLQTFSEALEVIACRYEMTRGSDEGTVTDEEKWDKTPYPLDRITGLGYSPAPDLDGFLLEVVTHLCNVQIFKRSGRKSEQSSPYPTLSRLGSSPWLKQLTNSLSKYDLRHDLGGLAFAKVWGLATLGVYTAVCVTFHPGDMVEYTITSLESATVIFGHQELPENELSHISHLPWAAAELRLRDANSIYPGIVSSVLEFSRKDLSTLCKRIVYAAACVGLLMFILDKSKVNLSQAAFQWLAHHDEVDLSEELNLCTKLRRHHTTDNDADNGEAAKASITPRSKATLQSDQVQSVFEVCEICGEGIGWYSIQEARCAAGHSFVRCALTFLAIQEPGISKYCERCGMQYLTEEALFKNNASQDKSGRSGIGFLAATTSGHNPTNLNDDGEPHASLIVQQQTASPPFESAPLVRMLFDKYDVCIFCGGKFVG